MLRGASESEILFEIGHPRSGMGEVVKWDGSQGDRVANWYSIYA